MRSTRTASWSSLRRGVLANDLDANSDPLTALLIAGPEHGTLTFNANGSFVYAPDPNYNGTDSFTYRAYDGILGSSPAAVTLTINPVNDAPVLSAIAAPAAVVEAADASAQDIAAISGTLPVNDQDVGDTLTASIVGASVSVDGGGTVPAGLAAILTASGALDLHRRDLERRRHRRWAGPTTRRRRTSTSCATARP